MSQSDSHSHGLKLVSASFVICEVELPEVPLAVENRTLMILREYLRPN